MIPFVKSTRTERADKLEKNDKPARGDLRVPPIAWVPWTLIVFASIGLGIALEETIPGGTIGAMVIGLNLIGLVILFGIQVADPWEKAIVLRLGRFAGLRGPGIFWVTPLVDRVSSWVDHRITVTPFSAEKTLTKDTVPVDVDAVLFWLVWDAEKAALEVVDYRQAISWAAQTALREVIGQKDLASILVGRSQMDKDLQQMIDERAAPWGVSVQSVEIRDIVIPKDLENAMSRQAQAERERQARVILGESEKQIAQSFADASLAYRDNPTALHLRAMNMLFEGLKEKGALVIVPSSAVETMNLGGMIATTALSRTTGNPTS